MRTRDKVRRLSDLSVELEPLRINKKIVHCHGVFDLVHVGHIRHFNEAKDLGDVLVVTITPDRYVNKGPHRPAFDENLRAEAVAALDCVDFVAINEWPMATETIKLIKPNFYVKGPDYKDPANDLNEGLSLERSAVNSVGGHLVITKDITASSTSLINRHLSPFSPEVSDFLSDFSSRYSSRDVIRYINGAQLLKVLVVGETIIDEYHYCEAVGKSSKDPMLVLRELSTEKFAGGILAVGNHVSGVASQVGMVTQLGDDGLQDEFIKSSVNSNIEQIFAYRENSPTIIKRRFIESYFFTKLLEVYEMNTMPLSEMDSEEICQLLRSAIPQYDVVLVVDYGHGLLNEEAVDILCRDSKFLAVNVQANAGNLGYNTVSKYPKADYICITENEIRLEARDRSSDLKDVIMDTAKKLSVDRVSVTRGKSGCINYSSEEGLSVVPALATEVKDRTGAGDAFLSLATLCVAQGAPMEVVGFVGNVAGAHAVATVGNSESIDRVSVNKHIDSLLKWNF